MRRFIRIIGRILLLLVLAALVVGVWKREELMRLWAVNSLFSEEKIVRNFSHMDAAFETRPVPAGDGSIAALAKRDPAPMPDGLDAWIAARSVTALVVLQGGNITHESYHLRTGPDDLRISWSVAKSFLSALLGVLIDEGKIASIDDPVATYAPDLTGGAYGGATIRNVLNMSSGVTFDEDYLDFDSDINRMGRVLALGGSMDDFAAGLTETFAVPGEDWQYVSIDTHVLGMVVRGATGRSIPDLLSEKIVRPLGLESDPYYVTDGYGVAFVLGGLNMTTRDYARFGQMILQDGRYNGQQIAPADWIEASIAPSAPTDPGEIGYGFQWWVPRDAVPGEVMARGVYGQYIYINRAAGVVIAANGADRRFREDGVTEANVAMFRSIAESVQPR